MSSPTSKRLHSANTVHLDSHATATLRYIRASIDAAGSLAVPGSAALALGAIGSLAAAMSSMTALRAHWITTWLAAAALAIGAGGTLVLRQFAPLGIESIVSRGPVRRFLLCLAPTLFAGLVITTVHWANGNVHSIPGTWLLLYGSSLVAVSAVTNKSMGVLGTAFLVLGSVTLALPESVHTVMLGVGFGGLHFVFGFYVRQTTHGS